MKTTEKREANESEALFKFIGAIGLLITVCGKSCFKGMQAANWRNPNLYLGILLWLVFSALLVRYGFFHLSFLDPLFNNIEALRYAKNFIWVIDLTFLSISFPALLFSFLGVFTTLKLSKFQKVIQQFGFKNSIKEEPKVQKIIKIDDNRFILKIFSAGVGPSSWQNKKEDLAFGFKAEIDEIKVSDDRNYIEIYLSKKPLPRIVKYEKYKDYIKEPYTFMVGEAKDGKVITESIRNCPHVLMGGATGMGKSTSFKLILYSLLRSSPESQISFTLIDLKRGVEVAEFDGFSNVTIAKNESAAVIELKKVSEEMHRRYRYLEKEKRTKIDPLKDKKPLIILAVDEASVIFGSKNSSSKLKNLSDEARELCQEIAKLGRAAGIHMILATQRATKTSIDTTTLDNLEARICFRTRSVAGSTAILGDKTGNTLPDIPGRAIWQKGIKAINLQVPFLPEEGLKKLCNELKNERSESKKIEQKSKVVDHKSNLNTTLYAESSEPDEKKQ